MKKTKLLMVALLVVICAGSIFAFRTRGNANADVPVVVIRTAQGSGEGYMYVYYGNSKFEEIKLEKLRADTQHKNWDLILNTINKFYAEGYHLVSSSERGENGFYNTFVLSR